MRRPLTKMKIELRLPFCTCGREKKPVRRKVRVGGSSGFGSRYSAMAALGGTLAGGSNSSFSRTPISTRSSSTWLPKTW